MNWKYIVQQVLFFSPILIYLGLFWQTPLEFRLVILLFACLGLAFMGYWNLMNAYLG